MKPVIEAARIRLLELFDDYVREALPTLPEQKTVNEILSDFADCALNDD